LKKPEKSKHIFWEVIEMKMRYLGKTGILVSELCLGTATFGGQGVFQKTGEIDQKQADNIVGVALDSGINFFNTAAMYSDGLAEEILGKALGKRRQDAIIITKIKPYRVPGPNEGGLSRKHIIEGCEASLKRLGTDYIDLYQMHEVDYNTPLEVSLRAMDDLIRAGKVRHIGCSNPTGWYLMKALSISDKQGWDRFVSLEIMYSLLSREVEFELVPAALDQGVGILAWSPLHGGFLSGKYRRNKPWPEGTRFNVAGTGDIVWHVDTGKLFNIVDEMERIAGEHHITVSHVALGYMLRKPGINSLIIGVRNAKQLEENLKAVEWRMSPEEVASLDKISEPVKVYPYNPLGVLGQTNYSVSVS
jgi:aryl-alcohol dehydrogenase-like predicted oxidoreductase